MKKALVTLEIPLPDEATQEDVDALAALAEHQGVTDTPPADGQPDMLSTDLAPYGRVVRTRLLDADSPLPEDRALDLLERVSREGRYRHTLARRSLPRETLDSIDALLAELGRGDG